ncbi:MAG: sulfatase [Polyangiales bacterium]
MRVVVTMVSMMAVLAAAGCDRSNGNRDPKPNELATADAPSDGDSNAMVQGGQDLEAVSTPAPVEAPAPEGTALYEDLLAQSHMAEIELGNGLFIDFGGAARNKYTNGDYQSGWGANRTIGSATASQLASKGSVYVSVDEKQYAGGGRVFVRARADGPRTLRLFLNGKELNANALAAGAFQTLTYAIPAGAMIDGENVFLFRTNGDTSFDWVMVRPGDAPIDPEFMPKVSAPTKMSALNVERDAIEIAKSDSRSRSSLTYYLEVPANAWLVFGASEKLDEPSESASALKVSIEADGDRSGPTELLSTELGPRWRDHAISLKAYGGKIARIKFRNLGRSALLSDLRVVREAPVSAAPQPATAKNVIVILIDTLRASKLQMYEPNSRVRTPAMDSFAKASVVFEHAQAPENWTKPSVASVLTSLSPSTHGTKEQDAKLPDSVLMVSEILKQSGFTTGSFIANGYVSDAFGFDQGWDYYTNYIRERRRTEAENVFGEAIKWIAKNKEKRFFAYVHTIDPHVPYDPPDRYLKMYDPEPYDGQVQNRRTHLMMDDAKKNPSKYNFTRRDKERIEALHDGEISYHDEFFGKFIKELDTLGILDNTIVVITADHGEEFQEHGSWGHGHSVYQELLHVPLIVSWKGVLEGDQRVPATVSTMDVAPTVLQALGIDLPDVFEGRSLLGFARNDWPEAPYVGFSEFMDHRRVVVGGGRKLILRGSSTPVYFDLVRDPWEKNELDGHSEPIAFQYLHMQIGQYLGASHRGAWRRPDAVRKSKTEPTKTAPKPKNAKQKMTPTLCKQLVALGYVTAECEKLIGK